MANFPDKSSIDGATLADVEEAMANLDGEIGRARRAEKLKIRDDAQQWLSDRAEYRLALQHRQVELLKLLTKK